MSHALTDHIVAVGQLGRTVAEAAARLGLAVPALVLVPPGEPIDASGAIVLLDSDLVAIEEVSGTPRLVIDVSHDGLAAASGRPEIALRRGPDVADAVATLLQALADGGLPEICEGHEADVQTLDLRPERPRLECSRLLAARAARRLLDGAAAGSGDPLGQSAAWSALREAISGGSGPWPGQEAADRVAPIAEDFARGRLPARELVARASAALGDLEAGSTTIPAIALAADLDRALAAALVSGGLARARALLSEALRIATREDPRGSGDLVDVDQDLELAEALADLDRRARDWALILTLTRRSALLAGLRAVSEAARRVAALRSVPPDRAPLVAMLESRWARLDDVEDQLAVLLERARDPARGVRAEDYLASLPGGEDEAAQAIVREVGAGPALLSGDLPGFLESRAARFFAWVPDLPLDEQLADLPAFAAKAAVVGIPGSVPASQAAELASRLSAAAVPLDSDTRIIVIRTRPASGTAVRQAGPAEVPGPVAVHDRRSRFVPPDPAGFAGPDPDVWLVPPVFIQDDPAAAVVAAWDAAACLKHERQFLGLLSALRADEDAWRAGMLAGSGPLEADPGAAVDALAAAAGLWEDRLEFWNASREALAAADDRATAGTQAAARPETLGAGLPGWYEEALGQPLDPLGDSAELATIGLATHLITHVGGYLAFAFREDNGLIHRADLAPADDPAGIVAGLLDNRAALPCLRRDARRRLEDARYHDAIRTFAHDLGAEVATRDWLRMPVSPHQRLLAERGIALLRSLPESSERGDVAAPSPDVRWDAGLVLPGLGAA